MNKIKKIFAIVLAVCVIGSFFVIPSAAVGVVDENNGVYVSLGDSIACGYTEAYFEDESLWNQTSDDAYAWDVAEAGNYSLAIDDGFTGAMCGARVEELLILLGCDSCDLYDAYNTCGGYYSGEKLKAVKALRDKVQLNEETKLVTLCIGSNNIAAYPLMCSGLKDDTDTTSKAAKVAKAVALVADGYAKFLRDYPRVIRAIKAKAPNAQIVVTGLYNPFRDVTLLDETLLPFGDAVTAAMALMTESIRCWAKEYGLLFANITDTETYFTVAARDPNAEGPKSLVTGMEKMIYYFHPTADGYAYIARQINDALSAECLRRNIKLDLNGLNADYITCVSINGKAICKNQYKILDEYTIFIYYCLTNAKTVTITTNDGTRIQTTTWQLNYHVCEGYRAYEMTKTDDLIAKVEDNQAKKTNLLSKIKSLFKK